ncbi:MAG: carbon-nitrogen family hydrolase [Phycisphaerae bacterium]|nr:carbon-nitrogen family hydrolase [Phycisphaerae bacterium]
MRLAAVQYDIAWQKKSENWAAMRRLLQAAALPAGSLALLPELADTGFTMDTAAVLEGDSLASATRMARDLSIAVVAGHGERQDAEVCNAASVIDARGEVLGTYRKVHLFSPGREHTSFKPGRSIVVAPVACGGRTWQVCPLVCYDLRFPELFRIAALAGAEVFVLGASWPAARAAHWRALAIARAIENQAYVVACNRIGHDPHTEYAGGSIIVGPDGSILAEAGNEACVLQADADHATLARWRERFPALRDARRSLIGEAPIESLPMR